VWGGTSSGPPALGDSGSAWWALFSDFIVLSDVASYMHVGLLIDKVWGFSVWRFVGGDGPWIWGKVGFTEGMCGMRVQWGLALGCQSGRG